MNKILQHLLLFFIVGVCTPVPLSAETYSWTDDSGTMNFTENYTNIPAKYRKKALKREEIEYDKPIAPSIPTRGNDVAKGNVQAEKQLSASSNQQKTEPKGTFGGKKAEEWAGEFRAMESEISSLAQKIRLTEEKLNKPTGLNKDQINRLPQEIVSLVTQRNNAIKRFNDLNDMANKAGVPAEYRK